jgi:hypothetical protein
MKKIAVICLVATFASSPEALSSYQMFCELKGSVLSTPTKSEALEFEYAVESSREIEVEVLGSGTADCHLLQGQTVVVALNLKDAGDLGQIIKGAKIVLERYDVDVVNTQSGAITRSVKYVRKDI